MHSYRAFWLFFLSLLAGISAIHVIPGLAQQQTQPQQQQRIVENVAAAVRELREELGRRYRVLGDFWIWCISQRTAAAGWQPRRDDQSRSHAVEPPGAHVGPHVRFRQCPNSRPRSRENVLKSTGERFSDVPVIRRSAHQSRPSQRLEHGFTLGSRKTADLHRFGQADFIALHHREQPRLQLVEAGVQHEGPPHGHAPLF